MERQSGFTLIELVTVIVILGILAAMAVPRFVDLRDEAELAAMEATAGAIASASVMNYASCATRGFIFASGKCETVTGCGEASGLIDPAPATKGSYFEMKDSPTEGLSNGDTFTCTLISYRDLGKGSQLFQKDISVIYVLTH